MSNGKRSTSTPAASTKVGADPTIGLSVKQAAFVIDLMERARIGDMPALMIKAELYQVLVPFLAANVAIPAQQTPSGFMPPSPEAIKKP